ARPARAEEWNALAREWQARGNLGAAVRAYEHAADAANGAAAAPILETLAQIYDTLGEHRHALEAARDAVAADPARGSAHRQLGLRLARNDEPERALRELGEAMRLGSEDAPMLSAIAALLARTGDPDGAAAMATRAAMLAP